MVFVEQGRVSTQCAIKPSAIKCLPITLYRPPADVQIEFILFKFDPNPSALKAFKS